MGVLKMHKCVNEERLRTLETKATEHDGKIDRLVESLKELTDWIKWLVRLLFVTLLGTLGYGVKLLIEYLLKGGV